MGPFASSASPVDRLVRAAGIIGSSTEWITKVGSVILERYGPLELTA